MPPEKIPPPRKNTPRKLAAGKLPPRFRKNTPRKLAAGKLPPRFFPLGKLPP